MKFQKMASPVVVIAVLGWLGWMQYACNVQGLSAANSKMLSPVFETGESKTVTKNNLLANSTTVAVELSNRGEVEREVPEIDLSQVSNIYDMVEQESNLIDLIVVYGNILIDSESSFRHNVENKNAGSVDNGVAQLNSKGEPLLFYLNKKITLADGRTVTVNRINYKTDARLNVAMGLRRYKQYLEDVGGDPFAAYAVYNIGGSITNVVKGKKGAVDVITAVRRNGNHQGANNLKNNYWVKYKKWMGATK